MVRDLCFPLDSAYSVQSYNQQFSKSGKILNAGARLPVELRLSSAIGLYSKSLLRHLEKHSRCRSAKFYVLFKAIKHNRHYDGSTHIKKTGKNKTRRLFKRRRRKSPKQFFPVLGGFFVSVRKFHRKTKKVPKIEPELEVVPSRSISLLL